MTELLVNGAAEQGLTGWLTVAGAPAALRYDTGLGYPQRGAAFFSGGGTALSTLRQSVTLPRRAARFVLSGRLGGYATQQDGARLSVEFLDSTGTPRGLVVLGPVTAEDREVHTGLFERSARARFPPGSRTAVVTLQMTRSGGGTFNDGYADNISFTVEAA